MPSTPVFYLYSTLGCHLCDEASAVIEDLHLQMLANFPLANGLDAFFVIEKIDIADDDALIREYGTRIPVLLSSDKRKEIDWPFDIQSVYDFMASNLMAE